MWEGRGNGSQVRELLRAIVRGENLCVDIYLIYIIYYKIYIIYIERNTFSSRDLGWHDLKFRDTI